MIAKGTSAQLTVRVGLEDNGRRSAKAGVPGQQRPPKVAMGDDALSYEEQVRVDNLDDGDHQAEGKG
jgi:hypothetical protein